MLSKRSSIPIPSPERDIFNISEEYQKVDTPVLSGYQIYHNYMRPHEGLDGKTPAEACGIKIEGENKWITIIGNASKKC